MKKHGFKELKAGSGDLRPGSSDEAESGYEHLKSPPLEPLEEPVSIERLRANIVEIIPLDSKSLSKLLLTNGIYIDRYRIGSASAGRERLFLIDEDKKWWQLGDFTEQANAQQKRPTATEVANSLRQLLLAINRDSEGLHIVEHLLLRPRTPAMSPTEQVDDFYSFKISVIFPSWTARCSNREFQNLARETLRLNAPAHIMPEFCWLNFADMKEFERLYAAWWKLKSSRDGARADFDRRAELVRDLDNKARQLKDFLIEHHEKRQTEE